MLFTTAFSEDEFAHLLQLQKDMGVEGPGEVIRAAVSAFKPGQVEAPAETETEHHPS